MRRLLPFFVAFVAASTPVFSQSPPATAASPPADPAKAVAEMRDDLMAKNISLSAAEAAKFWPLFEKIQAEQNAIIDAQLKGIKEYAAKYQLDDAAAITYVESFLKRDEQMTALSRKWLPEFKKVVSGRTAARVIQIDRRLGQAAQVMLSSQIPLVH